MEIIDSIEKLFQLMEVAKDNLGDDLWWRGQLDAEWQLLPSVKRGHTRIYESGSLVKFMNMAVSREAQLPLDEDFSGWLSVARHHGLPTRLLDWSESPLVALWFATADYAHAKKDASLFCLNGYKLNKTKLACRIP